MFLLQEVTWSGIMITFMVGIFGTIQAFISRRSGKEAKEAVAEAVTETARNVDDAKTVAVTHSELVLQKLDKLHGSVTELNAKVEVNRSIARRDVTELAAKIDGLESGHRTLFELLVDLDNKVSKPVRARPANVRVVAGE